VLPELVRVTLVLDREVSYHEESLTGPARVFFDLRNVEAVPSLKDAVLRYPSEILRQIRIGRHPNATRVVLDFEQVGRHSVYTLYHPFRIVIDAEAPGAGPSTATATRSTRAPVAAANAGAPSAGATLPAPPPMAPPVVVTEAPVVASVIPAVEPAVRDVSSDATVDKPVALSAPVAPRGNLRGGFSIARQLGLGVSRVVIDPGHGGHDPGAQVRGLDEADLTLDVALRLEALLKKEPGLEVVLTRRTDVYLSLEERTEIANREGADLFLSIHANTSRNVSASGVETYFLSFAGSPDAEAVAARENSSHIGEMNKLPDLIRAITLNNKLDESRDFAGMVQEALVTRLRRSNASLSNRGVKKAPFVVLIGAEMPSVLAEVSFMTNKKDLQLLKTATYKQRIAEALHAAVMRYRRSLKGSATALAQ
jgi:N-acetylmuramoyl-L-alanine amidase